jgi:hypothetical protein
MLNLSPLFHTTTDENCLIFELDIPDDMRQQMAKIKGDLRQHLKNQLVSALKMVGVEEPIEPRFFTQGSWAYKTINHPCIMPPQQADLDDGCYLPMTFVKDTSNRPKTASKLFFSAIEMAMQSFANKHGYKLDKEKPTCVRLIVDQRCHIDIPLYAIPDEEYPKLEKAALSHGFESLSEAMILDSAREWETLPEDEVLLAHREHDWIISDPRPMFLWFNREVAIHGEQLRRVVRYLKAWRDYQWKHGGPSSILLMATASLVFEKHERRDDLALLHVAKHMPDRLREGVNNPANSAEILTDRLGKDGVEEAASKLADLARYIEGAVLATDASLACRWMIEQFGDRFPQEPHRIKQSNAEETVRSSAVKISNSPPAVGSIMAGGNCP